MSTHLNLALPLIIRSYASAARRSLKFNTGVIVSRDDKNPEATIDDDIDVYANNDKAPGAMRAGFEYYKAFPIDAEQNKEIAKSPITTPVLALSGDAYQPWAEIFPTTLFIVR